MHLAARHIAAGYLKKEVLHRVDVSLNTGEFVGLIGPNGCGKSTLLRVLARTLRTRTGEVQLDGRDVSAYSSRDFARALGFVPQQEKAAFDFVVQDVVLMGRYAHRAGRTRVSVEDFRCATQALAQADILHLKDRLVTSLSGGEYRRVLLARAFAQDTPLLLLDEPTAHLDITHQVELLLLLRKRTHQPEGGFGALAALHDLNQAAEFCDRLILMHEGTVIAEGVPGAVLTARNLRIAYGAQVQIGRNAATGRPTLLAVYPAGTGIKSGLEPSPRIHLICGGGSGVQTLGTLSRAGCRVTVGVLNRLDTDQEAADALEYPTVVEAPFSAIGPVARAACAALIENADTIVIAPVPFGNGNYANLELARTAQASGKTVVLIGDSDFGVRDFTGGKALALQQLMLSNGALQYERIEEWLLTLQEQKQQPAFEDCSVGAAPALTEV